MKRLKTYLSGLLFLAGVLLIAGGCEGLSWIAVGIGTGCLLTSLGLCRSLEKEGFDDEEDL